ncbi:MAG: 2-amino-4-oxopentanoate thiolase subunit OrtA [Candidatus Heimdallarchaeota archaeon]
MKAKRGDWVQIHKIILQPGERSPRSPEDTQQVPYEMRVKGFLLDNEAKIGQEVSIRTLIGRTFSGKLIAINPTYPHNFGEPVPELLSIGIELRELLTKEEGGIK